MARTKKSTTKKTNKSKKDLKTQKKTESDELNIEDFDFSNDEPEKEETELDIDEDIEDEDDDEDIEFDFEDEAELKPEATKEPEKDIKEDKPSKAVYERKSNVIEVEEDESFELTSTLDDYNKKFNKDYYKTMKENGCDYKEIGVWQREYGRMIMNSFNLKDKLILDIGAACGAITEVFKGLGAKPIAVEVSADMIKMMPKNLPYIQAMAQNLPKLIKDNSVSFAHLINVLNDIPSHELGHVFESLKRVMTKDGIIMMVFEKGNNQVVNDKTKHANETVVDVAKKAGFKQVDFTDRLKKNDSEIEHFMDKYNWNILFFKK